MFIVLCNCPPDTAPKLAKALVAGRYAACVNIIAGVQSIYEWEGEICADTESTLIIKTSALRIDALREQIVELHPYSVPEIIATRVDTDVSHRPYVEWVEKMTR